MGLTKSDYLTAQFYAWEQRGRGWNHFDHPVELESEFIPFFGHYSPPIEYQIDDGKRPRFFPKLQEALGLFKKSSTDKSVEEALDSLDDLYPVNAYIYENYNPITEFQINFDKDTRVGFETIEQLLLMLSTSEGIAGFEIYGTKESIIFQFVCSERDPISFKSHISSYAPDIRVNTIPRNLHKYINVAKPTFIDTLGLRYEFMRPLRIWTKFDPDPLTGVISALESLEDGEFGMLQILFQGTRNPWAESILRSVSDGKGGSFFADAPEMLPLSKEKVSSPLFATIIRAAGQAKTNDKAKLISQRIAQSLISFNRSGSNSLISLGNPKVVDISEILDRTAYRTGMLLNGSELASLIHIPDRSITSSKLRKYVGKTKEAPSDVSNHPFQIGTNSHLGHDTIVSLSDQHRLRHTHIMGATGTGKSSLLLKLIIQDINQGRGITVLDPHGDLIDDIIKHIPSERLQDVILVDPSDNDYPIGLNLLSARSEVEKIVLSSDLIALFRRFATSWGDQMTSVLSNAINAILESSQGGTLVDLRRFLVESGFRNSFLKSVSDPNILYYWKHEFKLLRQNSIAPILTRLDTFLRPKIVRYMMAQKEGLDFENILNTNKVLLVKLAQGSIGEENSYLLGTLIVAKIHQAAQSRQNLSPEERIPHYFYIDEFQNFITPSMSAILSGARKYGLGLVLAHQDFDQLASKDIELANSVLSNPAVRICFRCGDKDAAKLENGFSYFDSTDLQSLSVGQSIVRVGQKDHDFNLSFSLIQEVDTEIALEIREQVVRITREKYSIHSSEIESLLLESYSSKEKLPLEPIDQDSPIIEKPISNKHDEQIAKHEQSAVSKVDIQEESQRYIETYSRKENTKEHRYLQEYIKKLGESRNFKVTLEEPVNNHTGKVDVSLIRDNLSIACEISVTNTVEYEVQNIMKCISAKFNHIFMISNNQSHLNAIRSAAIKFLNSDQLKIVHFIAEQSFIIELDNLLALYNPKQESRSKGYRVKLHYKTNEDNNLKENVLKKAIVDSIKRKK